VTSYSVSMSTLHRGYQPYLDSSQPARGVLLHVAVVQDNDLVVQDVPVARNRPLLDYGVIGAPFVPRYEKDPFRVPSCKEGVIRIAPIYGDDGNPGEGKTPSNVQLVDVPFGDTGKHRQAAAMVEEEMKFYGTFCLAVRSPVEERGTQLNRACS